MNTSFLKYVILEMIEVFLSVSLFEATVLYFYYSSKNQLEWSEIVRQWFITSQITEFTIDSIREPRSHHVKKISLFAREYLYV
jgi:hypothetical protein